VTVAPDTPQARLAAEDDELVERIRTGSAQAFEEIYNRYCDRVYRVAWSVCRDDGRAEDAVQEAFSSVWHNASSYRNARGSVAAWLLSTVRHRAIDVGRRNAKHASRRAREDLISSQHGTGDMAEGLVASESAMHLAVLLKRLPDAQREVIALAFYGQLTHADIASQLGLPEGTVKGRMRLGLQKLRTDIEQVGA
jgi:RNA polymerase sigma-70 factor (ECF subfamily)